MKTLFNFAGEWVGLPMEVWDQYGFSVKEILEVYYCDVPPFSFSPEPFRARALIWRNRSSCSNWRLSFFFPGEPSRVDGPTMQHWMRIKDRAEKTLLGIYLYGRPALEMLLVVP